MSRQPCRPERGSAALEAAIGLPAFMLFVALIVLAGRVAITTQAVDSAATASARTASIARTTGDANASARSAAAASLADQNLRCVSTTVTVDTTGFSAPLGTPATVTATVRCVVNLADLALPGVPGTRTVTATATSPVDTSHTPMTRHLRRREERGSVSLWLVTTGFAMIVLVGLAVDLGGQVHAQQHARAVADQAARTGGQQLQAPVAVRGQGLLADTHRAAKAAKAFLTASGMTGTVTITGSTTVTVDVRDTYDTTFLGIIGITSMTVTGHGQARITRSVGGVEQ
jgi:Flp pilus assembly protein TadG